MQQKPSHSEARELGRRGLLVFGESHQHIKKETHMFICESPFLCYRGSWVVRSHCSSGVSLVFFFHL